jgi:hypothetical protein
MRIKFVLLWLTLPFLLFSVPCPRERAPWPPFISGDAFRAYADYVFDELDSSLNPHNIKPNSTIFVKWDYLGNFFRRIHPHLPPYILITHNSDGASPGHFIAFLRDENLIAWFSQNVDDFSNPKIHPIPIGIANRMWGHGNGDLITRTQKREHRKSHLLYLNICEKTYPKERKLVKNLLEHAPFVYSPPVKSFEDYLHDLASSKFVASPRGNGLDTHRLWESLYLGAYPIVKSTSLDSLYDDLPVVIVDNWNLVTEEFLEKKYEEFGNKSFNLDKLYISYWIKLIDSFK